MFKSSQKLLTLAAAAACLALLSGQPALAAKNSSGPGGHLTIETVVADTDTGMLVITGNDLDFGKALEVRLGGFGQLTVLSEGPTEIKAMLPAGITPGDYLLTVARGNGQSKSDEYDLTIGAVGPQGEPGPPGQFDPVPQVVLVPANSHPPIPADLKVTCLVDPFSTASSDTCPVVKWAGYTYWAYSYIDNRISMNVVAYRDVDDSIALQTEKSGARYVHAISVDTATRIVTFTGQSNAAVTMTAPEPWLLF